MSTKIYEAYRVREGVGLWPLLWAIQDKARGEFYAELALVYHDIMHGRAAALHEWRAKGSAWMTANAHAITDLDERLAAMREVMGPRPDARVDVTTQMIRQDIDGLLGDAPLHLAEVDKWVRSKYANQLASRIRNEWDLDVSIAIRELDGRFYLIPHFEKSSVVRDPLGFLDTHPDLEHFGYWTNTDPPEEVAEAEWAERKRVWDRLGERWHEHVLLSIVSFDTFDKVSPLVLLREAKGEASS